jgi:hypothetical protein
MSRGFLKTLFAQSIFGSVVITLLLVDRGIGAEQIPIRPDTALAKLVQEASGHGPEMTIAAAGGSKVDIPRWLAAHYRRNHSELPKAALQLDPTGGYPLALENLFSWMLLHQDLQPSQAPEAKAASAPSVGANLKISGDNDSPRSESEIRVNPGNPLQIIAASNNIGNGRQAQFSSPDGGKTWGQTTLPLLSADSMHSDPTVHWTSDGTAWATTIGINADSTVLQMRAYKSTDAGKTWTFDATFSGDQTAADKQSMWTDWSQTSPFRDRIYVIWHNNRPAYVSSRSGSGWHKPVLISGAETTGTAIGSDITTNESGHVFAVWPDTGSKGLFVAKSTDGGETFSSPRLIHKTFGSFQISVPSFGLRAALVGTSIAAHGSDVYVSWVDLSGDPECRTPASEPADDINSVCTSRVWFTQSSDAGDTWSDPIKINPDPSLVDQFNHRLAIDPQSGILGVIYYSTGTAANRKKTDLVFQFSSDSGKKWSKVTKVTTAMTDETTVHADNGNQYGDYNGLSAANGGFFTSWTDRRDDRSEAIFTAKINLRPISAADFEVILAGSATPSGQK